ncbi:MAG: hypothetical protein IJH50_03870 [Kiritimatiellae bacterium]|nr:hypothetical protein [Kiritimatiellia bacterium]
MDLTRRGFIGGGAALCAMGGRLSAAAADAPIDYDAIQKEIEALPPKAFEDFVYGENMAANRSNLPAAECEAWYAKYPILRRYDEAFRKVVDDMRRTKVDGDTPAVWYVYNMGVIVKTRKSLFSIDLCHRLAPTIADELDFAIISHNHLDHYTREFYRAMDGRHKTVFQNFECNYGAALHIVNGKLAGAQGGYSYGNCKYDVKDVTIRTYVSDHNPILRKFVMPVEVHIGDYTILHSGDTHDVQNLRPVRTPDMWIHHAWCWGGCYKREEWANSETVRGIRAFHPRLAVVSHHQELTHTNPGRRTFSAALDRKTAAEEEGVRAVVPFWGDRIA